MLCETPHPGRAGARRRNAPAPLPRFPGRLPEGHPRAPSFPHAPRVAGPAHHRGGFGTALDFLGGLTVLWAAAARL